VMSHGMFTFFARAANGKKETILPNEISDQTKLS